MKRLVKGALVYQAGTLKQEDVLINQETGVIEAAAQSLSTDMADETIEAEGKLLAPGFIDVHIHLREPGGEHKETVRSGTKAAAAGGFTTVCAMPNTNPVPDSAETLKEVQSSLKDAFVHVHHYGSLTKSLKGEALTDMESLKNGGICAFTDDGVGIQQAGLMKEAMKRAAALGLPVAAHCEDNSLVNGGVMHEGKQAEALGLPGISSSAESVHIARDVLLAEETGAHYHVCHVSTKESVRIIRDAKKAGIHVTAEVTPHHLLLTEEDIPGDDPLYKMNPPLRSSSDRLALVEGLLDGTIDFIATDHAPHATEEKRGSMRNTPFGIIGLETAFPLLYTFFVKNNQLPLTKLIDWMSAAPAGIFQLKNGGIKTGERADLVLIDIEKPRTVIPQEIQSASSNTPFFGWELSGWPEKTFCSGRLVWDRKERE
ncbi:dihydroorotase [Alkalicoccus urumqiensis]|uniref:dihydroorotase n=1 Tax=Alkalicoccus urumqiensis TaxID=1548213 RepID=UPI0026D8A1CE